ncbi:MAG: ribonuclease [Betaproteobacteria bacterium]|jgi:ribonuclease T1|nr:ribonuclease [Betaproteobacteria bacterium]HNL20650.1 ribonuclease domain-containing protein [Rhodocyclaceae bacterium]
MGLRVFLVAWLALASLVGLAREDHLDVVRLGELPPEARQTLMLIREGGPFPHARDGVVFGNYERRLPARPRGYYREYTVRTPGRSDRGPRRIVAGNSGEYFYTGDHYRSFRRIRE